jgi:hypothetical protein
MRLIYLSLPLNTLYRSDTFVTKPKNKETVVSKESRAFDPEGEGSRFPRNIGVLRCLTSEYQSGNYYCSLKLTSGTATRVCPPTFGNKVELTYSFT